MKNDINRIYLIEYISQFFFSILLGSTACTRESCHSKGVKGIKNSVT